MPKLPDMTEFISDPANKTSQEEIDRKANENVEIQPDIAEPPPEKEAPPSEAPTEDSPGETPSEAPGEAPREAPSKEDKEKEVSLDPDDIPFAGDEFKKVKGEEVSKPPEPSPKPPEPEPPPPTEGTRDYTGFTEDEVRAFKNMSRQAFEFIKPRIELAKQAEQIKQENQQLKQKVEQVGLPDSYLDHPNAYILDPEFIRIAQSVQTSNQLIAHWDQQLKKIRAGETSWHDLELDAQGNIVQVQKEASADAEDDIRQRIIENKQEVRRYQDRVNQIQQGFSAKAQTFRQAIKQVEDQFFPSYADDTKLAANPDAQVVLSGLKERGLENNILSKFVAKMYAHGITVANQLKQIKAEADKYKKLYEQAKRAGIPSSKVPVSGTPAKLSADEQPYDPDRFAKVKSGF